MGLEDRKLKVFVSSSMKEFSEERGMLNERLNKLKIPNFTFEKEGASGQSPREKFEEAIPRASVYVGIFGKALGQYTEEEYRLARKHEVSCHIYFLKMNETERSEDCRRFHAELYGVDGVPTINEFTTWEELYDQIVADLFTWYEESSGTRARTLLTMIRDNLPVLCDRQDQHDHLRREVKDYFAAQPRIPLLLMVPGDTKEGHRHLLSRMEWRSLPTILRHIPSPQQLVLQDKKVKICELDGDLLPWHSFEHVWERLLEVLPRDLFTKNVGRNLEGNMEEGREGEGGPYGEIADYIVKEHLDAFLIGVHIYASACRGDLLTPLHTVKDFLSGITGIPDHVLFGCVVCLHDDQKSGVTERLSRWLNWKKQRAESLGDRAARDFLTQMEGQQLIHAAVLPRLHSPELRHGRAWLGLRDVKSYLQEHRPSHPIQDQDIVAIFEPNGAKPMNPLHDALRNLLITPGPNTPS